MVDAVVVVIPNEIPEDKEGIAALCPFVPIGDAVDLEIDDEDSVN